MAERLTNLIMKAGDSGNLFLFIALVHILSTALDLYWKRYSGAGMSGLVAAGSGLLFVMQRRKWKKRQRRIAEIEQDLAAVEKHLASRQ